MFRHGDIALFMFEHGAIDEARLRSSLRILPLYQGAGRTIWQRQKENFVESYRDYVDRLLSEGFWD